MIIINPTVTYLSFWWDLMVVAIILLLPIFISGGPDGDGELIYYENGVEIRKGSKVDQTYLRDLKTNLTVGKHNGGTNKYFAKFMINDLVIYYKVLTGVDVQYLYGEGTV